MGNPIASSSIPLHFILFPRVISSSRPHPPRRLGTAEHAHAAGHPLRRVVRPHCRATRPRRRAPSSPLATTPSLPPPPPIRPPHRLQRRTTGRDGRRAAGARRLATGGPAVGDHAGHWPQVATVDGGARPARGAARQREAGRPETRTGSTRPLVDRRPEARTCSTRPCRPRQETAARAMPGGGRRGGGSDGFWCEKQGPTCEKVDSYGLEFYPFFSKFT